MEIQPYEWMVKATPHKQWIEGPGILVWLTEVLSVLGGGSYVAGFIFGFREMMFWGWIVVVFGKGFFHLLHLGYPWRAWRMLLKPAKSWLSRGIIFIVFFFLFGLVEFFDITSGQRELISHLNFILSLLIISYGGFVLKFIKRVPLWNTSLLPWVFLTLGLAGGGAMAVSADAFSSSRPGEIVSITFIGTIILMAGVVTFYLLKIMGNQNYKIYWRQVKLKDFWWDPMLVVFYGGGVFSPLMMFSFGLDYLRSFAYLSTFSVVTGISSFLYFLMKEAFYIPLVDTFGQGQR